jgi:hypothetical protein
MSHPFISALTSAVFHIHEALGNKNYLVACQRMKALFNMLKPVDKVSLEGMRIKAEILKHERRYDSPPLTHSTLPMRRAKDMYVLTSSTVDSLHQVFSDLVDVLHTRGYLSDESYFFDPSGGKRSA